jgi:long-chain fatty acid transport protein
VLNIKWAAVGSFGLAAIVAAAAEALGSGFQLRENSAAALGNAFAGAAVSGEDPSIAANNPAGMTALSGNPVSGNLSVVIPSASFSGSAFNAARQPISGGNGGDAGGAQSVPALYAIYDAAADLKFGLAVTAPFGLNSQYDSGWVGRYQAIKSGLEVVNINPSIAYRLTDWLSIGGGPAIQRASAELTSAINSTAVAHLANPLLPAGFVLPDGFVRVTGDSWSVGYNLGVLAQILPGTRLGASYRSQIGHRLEGSGFVTVPAPLSADPRFHSTPTQTDLKTPGIVSLAASQQIAPDIVLLAEVQWTNWGVVKNLRVQRPDGSSLIEQPEEWHRTWFGSIGASWHPDPNWTLRGGFAFDATPVRDQFRTARLPDADRYWLAVGLGYRCAANLRFDAAYVHIFAGSVPINEVSPTGDQLTGHFAGHVDLVSLSATLRF